MFGLLFFRMHLALVLKIVPVGEEFTADRYLYLPLIGLLIAGVELVTRFPPRLHRPAAWAAIVIVGVFSASSYARSADWRDDMTFNSRILERYPVRPPRMRIGPPRSCRRATWTARTATAPRRSASIRRTRARTSIARRPRCCAGRPVDALADANRLIDLDPGLATAYELRAQARLRTDDIPRRARRLEQGHRPRAGLG
jgi:hypothetical protein